MRLMYSGRDFAWIYERQDQVSFLDGHVRAFAHFGGVPARLAYDHLKPAVTRILVGGERALTTRFVALASHYLFEPCVCRPGEGHDKGGVEARGKALRRQALTPIPSAPTLEGINLALLARVDARLETGRDIAGQTIATRFAEEAAAFRSLPPPFVAEATTVATVSPRALVRLEGAVYSVPCRWADLDLIARIGATGRASCIRGSASGSARSITGTTSRSLRANRKRSAKCSPSCCAISVCRFPPYGSTSTPRTPRAKRPACLRRCWGSSMSTDSIRSCPPSRGRWTPARPFCWRSRRQRVRPSWSSPMSCRQPCETSMCRVGAPPTTTAGWRRPYERRRRHPRSDRHPHARAQAAWRRASL